MPQLPSDKWLDGTYLISSKDSQRTSSKPHLLVTCNIKKAQSMGLGGKPLDFRLKKRTTLGKPLVPPRLRTQQSASEVDASPNYNLLPFINGGCEV